MQELLGQKLTPVAEDAQALDDLQISELQAHAPDWRVVAEKGEKHLRRIFEFPDFAEAIKFANSVAEQAEIEDHHPKMVIEWGQVTVDWWTHAVKGLHTNDFILATRIDDIYSRWDLIGGSKDAVEQASEESFPASDSPGW